MKYDAVTLDTNIFDENGRNLEQGLLGRFVQFAEGSAQFVLSEIVWREMHKHLKDHNSKAKAQLDNAIKNSALGYLLKDTSLIALQNVSNAAIAPDTAATNRLFQWQMRSHCKVIEAANADIARLIAMYFAPSAPFEGSGSKKHEFPDAIALITLEDWARTERKKLLAITRDQGWNAFCETSEWIDTEADLATALQRFQEHTESARKLVAELLGAVFLAGQLIHLRADIDQRVAAAVAEMEFDPDFNSDYEITSVGNYDLRLRWFKPNLVDATKFDYRVVQTGANEIVASISIAVSAAAEIELTYYRMRKHERAYVGRSRDAVLADFDASLLLTISGEDVSTCKITNLELIDTPADINFGDVGPDFGNYDHDE
jgi:hypothetical protein